jgi:hypothetical protein
LELLNSLFVGVTQIEEEGLDFDAVEFEVDSSRRHDCGEKLMLEISIE